MYSSVTVANRFLGHAAAAKNLLTPMQVLKLVYIAHGWSLGLTGRPLIRDDVEAWKYGPVIPTLYDTIRSYGARHIDAPLLASSGSEEALDDASERIIRQTFEKYGAYSGPALSRLTHMPGTPWERVYDGSFGAVIPVDLIEDHYARLKQPQPAA